MREMRYKVYIDITNDDVENFVEFFPDNLAPFKLTRGDDQYFKRFGWGEISISNDPDLYAATSSSIYKLYDVISALDFTFEIKVKFVSDTHTILGYFGVNDCEFDDDRKMISVTPTIQDDYTAILESWETEIPISTIEYSTDEIDLNITSLGTRTKSDWDMYWRIPQANTPVPHISYYLDTYNDDIGGINGFFDGEAPKRSLINLASNPFKQSDGQTLEDRESVLGEDFSSLTLSAYVSFDEYDSFASSGSTNDVVTFGGLTYKSIQSGNTGNQPDISPLWWEVIYVGELFPEKGDFELSELTIWQGTSYNLSGFGWMINLYCSTKFSRDEFRKIDVVDVSDPSGYEPPSGSGWHMREKILVEGEAGHLWTRKPYNGAYTEDWVLQDQETNDSGESTYRPWFIRRTTKIFYPDDTNSKTITSTVTLKSFLEFIFQNTSSEFTGKSVYSTFFFNDNEASLPILANRIGEGLNYVNMSDNYLNQCRIFFTKDLITDLDTTDTDNFPKITLKDTLEDLVRLFKNNIYWYMDSSLNLHIEHIKYLDLTLNATDIRYEIDDITKRIELEFTESWKYDKSKMYNLIELRQVNAGGVDFTENTIIFDKIVSNKRNVDIKQELETSIFSTDLRYAIENGNDLESGVILITTKNELKPPDPEDPLVSILTIVVRNKVGFISEVSEVNGYMALSNLLYDFGRYEGVWTEGTLNGAENTAFVYPTRSKQGDEILLRGANFDSLFYITNLGVGLLDDGTVDFSEENTTLNLLYRYNSVPNSDGFVLMVQKETDFVGAEEIWFDIGNYET